MSVGTRQVLSRKSGPQLPISMFLSLRKKVPWRHQPLGGLELLEEQVGQAGALGEAAPSFLEQTLLPGRHHLYSGTG